MKKKKHNKQTRTTCLSFIITCYNVNHLFLKSNYTEKFNNKCDCLFQVIFYSTGIFQNAGLEKEAAVYATLGMGTINVLMTIVSMVLVEKAGRKTLHLVGLGGMMVITLLLTICLALTVSKATRVYFV